MKDYFEDLDSTVKEKLSAVYNEMLAIKSHKRALLDQYGVDRVEELMKKIKKGEIDEHPAYDHYLAILALDNELQPLREECRTFLEEA